MSAVGMESVPVDLLSWAMANMLKEKYGVRTKEAVISGYELKSVTQPLRKSTTSKLILLPSAEWPVSAVAHSLPLSTSPKTRQPLRWPHPVTLTT